MRDRLRDARRVLDEAVRIETRALSDASRARQRVAEAQEALSIFADLQARETAATIEALQTDWTFTTTGKPPADFELPDELRDLRRAEPAARERLKQLELAAASLDETAERAHREAEHAAAREAMARAAVLTGEADALAAELERAELHASGLRQRLLALSMTWTPQTAGRSGPLALTPETVRILREPSPPAVADPAETARWTAWLKALSEDADALPPPPKMVERPKPPAPFVQPPAPPWLEQKAILERRHGERVKAAALQQASEQLAALKVHRDAAAKIREQRTKNIA